jgi:hypothetical protein
MYNRLLGIREEKIRYRSRITRIKITALCLVIVLVQIGCSLVNPEALGQTLPLKVLISEDGIYTISGKDLKAVGWDYEYLDPALLKMIHQGRSVPVWVEGEGSNIRLIFYGKASDNAYTSLNPYFLIYEGERADGSQVGYDFLMDTVGDGSGEGEIVDYIPRFHNQIDSYVATLHVEENLNYSPQVEVGDPWLWDSLTAPQEDEYEITLINVVDTGGKITLEIWGKTESEESPDHHVQVSINDHPIADELWDGGGRYSVMADIPEGVLKEGKNSITINSPGDTGVIVDIIFLDWLKIEYSKQYIATNDRLEFRSDGQISPLSGFSGDISIFDVTEPNNIEFIGKFENSLGDYDYTGDDGHKYLALGPRGYLRPDTLVPLEINPELFDTANVADYIAIGPVDLLEPLEPLLEHRTAQGLQVMSIPVEVIYNQFGYGLPTPEGIHAFLRYVNENWEAAPKFVLLVGDASHDPRGYISDPENNQLPTFFIQTAFGGKTASDILFTQLDDDLMSDIAIGRIPARNSKQVQIFVEKLIAYEKQEHDDWQQRVLAISDGQEPIFESEAQAFLNQFSSEYQTELIATVTNSSRGLEEVSDGIEKGNIIVSYFGHGSIDMWGKDQLFTEKEAKELRNKDRLPVVMTMSCLNGLFTHTEIESLAETLLWNSEGGAVAVLAPTSLTLTTDQTILSQAFVKNLIDYPDASLGEVILKAQHQIPNKNPGAVEVLLTFLLFGDPAMHLAYP